VAVGFAAKDFVIDERGAKSSVYRQRVSSSWPVPIPKAEEISSLSLLKL
jgi:hypothetical protein